MSATGTSTAFLSYVTQGHDRTPSLFGRPELVVRAIPPGRIERHPVGRIGGEKGRLRPIEEPGHIVGVRGIAAQQAMVAQDPQVSGLVPHANRMAAAIHSSRPAIGIR